MSKLYTQGNNQATKFEETTKLIVERGIKVLQDIELLFINLEVSGREGHLYPDVIIWQFQLHLRLHSHHLGLHLIGADRKHHL